MWEFCGCCNWLEGCVRFVGVWEGLTMRWASLRNSSATSVDGVQVAGAGMERACLVVRMVFRVGVRSVIVVDWRAVASVFERGE